MPFVDDMELDNSRKKNLQYMTEKGTDSINVFGEIDESQTIWRYLSFVQLLNILETDKLHFTRADWFQDEEEGTLPDKEELPDKFWEMYDEEYFEDLKSSVFISCWHINEHEHWGMWQNYSGKGVATKTTIEKFRKALRKNDNHGIHFAEVEYLNYDDEELGFEVEYTPEIVSQFTGRDVSELEGIFGESGAVDFAIVKPLTPFGYKRRYFGYENEFRAITMPVATNPVETEVDDINIQIDKSELIDEVILSPLADDWEIDTMERVLSSKYGMAQKVSESRIQ